MTWLLCRDIIYTVIKMNENLFFRPEIKRDSDFEEKVSVLYETNDKRNIRIEKIISSYNQTDWYDQNEDEFVCLLTGIAELEFEGGETKTLTAGDTILIEKHKRHRVKSTTECNWLCMFF